jgi:hypothetical protein
VRAYADAVGESIPAKVGTWIRTGGILWAAIATAAVAAWLKAVDVARWMESVAPKTELAALAQRVDTLEGRQLTEDTAALLERESVVKFLRQLATEGAAAAQRTPGLRTQAALKAGETFDRLMIRGYSPTSALATTLREAGAIVPKGLGE